MTCRLYSLNPEPVSSSKKGSRNGKFRPKTFSGHRSPVIAAYWSQDEKTIYTVSKDGACFVWEGKEEDEEEVDQDDSEEEEEPMEIDEQKKKTEFQSIATTRWGLKSRNYFNQTGTRVVCSTLHASTSLLCVGFSSGIFSLYSLEDLANPIHTLSISNESINTVSFDESGEWLSFGCSNSGQLLVWEWRSESYILKQQSHSSSHGMNCFAYNSDGSLGATGGDDSKIKLWDMSSGFCIATFEDHSSTITALEFSSNQVLFSASLDGTIRAYDLIRFRNFRTFSAPKSVQFSSLAIEPSGEILVGGGNDSFEIYMWEVRSGKIIEILNGHTGPISSLKFSPNGNGTLISCSWDKSIRIWETFRRSANTEPIGLSSDGLSLTIRPDGKEIAVATLDGNLSFFDIETLTQTGVIQCRLDISGGRKQDDKITRNSTVNSANFRSIVYSADGNCVLAAGNSNFICLYDVREKVLLKKFLVSQDEDLDGIRDKLDSRKLTEAGPVSSLNHDENELELTAQERIDKTLPGAQSGDMSKRKTLPISLTKCIRFSPTGRSFSAATTSGLLVYSLDSNGGLSSTNNSFDPLELDIDLTPENVRKASKKGESLVAIVGAIRLGEGEDEKQLLMECYEETDVDDIELITGLLPINYSITLLRLISKRLVTNGQSQTTSHVTEKSLDKLKKRNNGIISSPHLEFHLIWLKSILNVHGQVLRSRSTSTAASASKASSNSSTLIQSNNIAPTLRLVASALNNVKDGIKKVSEENGWKMLYLWGAMGFEGEESL